MSPANTTASNSGDVMNLAFGGLLIFAVFILPFILGAFVSKSLRMPNHGFSIGLILAAVIGAGLTIGLGEPRYGVDIKGGTILKYEIDKTVKSTSRKTIRKSNGDTRVRARDLVPSLTQRINPTGTKEIVIRPMGEDQSRSSCRTSISWKSLKSSESFNRQVSSSSESSPTLSTTVLLSNALRNKRLDRPPPTIKQ